jgi:non-specific serine/threonine protein kinase/serine/threonine-protein kinase
MIAIEDRARSIFFAALEQSSDEWLAFLDASCGGDAELRARVDRLLSAHKAMGSIHGGSPNTPDSKFRALPAEGPSTVIGPYKLLEQIGEGGMGLVFVAEQQRPVRRRVALKLIKPGMDSRQVLARFEAERQALALMDHLHIARVFDGGTTESGRPYFVMELVKGVPITDYCDQNCLTPRQRLELFLDVCAAVQHAHQKGVIHRDLKPSNIMVTVHDVRPVVKVIDFGIAKATGAQLTEHTLFTQFAQMVGTPLYMSPEQAGHSGLDVDTRSDVYSLGVLLYELLTGTTPFDGETLKRAGQDELRRIIREDEPARPSARLSTLAAAELSTVAEKRGADPKQLSQAVRGELDWIVMRCLEKDRNRRYESASALAADVRRYLNDEPVQACPPSAGYRLRKFARRNRRALATAGVIAAALVAATVVSVWQAAQARDAERRAATEAAIARAVNDFLQGDLLGQVISVPVFGEASAGNPHLTVREALDRAAARIGDRFRDQPLVEAAIRMTIGEAYNRLYSFGNGLAVPHLKRAFELRRDHLSPDHPDTLASMASLANAYQMVDQHQEAIALIERRLEIGKATLGPDHPETLAFMARLAGAYRYAGRRDLSVPLWEQVLDKRRTICGPTHPDTLGAIHQLALNYMDVGRFKDSMALHAKFLDGWVASYGPRHGATIWPMMTFAQACQRAGELDRADRLLREVLELNRKREDSLNRRETRANALGWLALNRLWQERHGEAERTAREALAIDQIHKHRRFYCTSVLGAALLGQKKYAEAEPLLLQGYAGMKQSETGIPEGYRRRLLTDAGEWVVRFYEATNQPEKAREWREKLKEDTSKK